MSTNALEKMNKIAAGCADLQKRCTDLEDRIAKLEAVQFPWQSQPAKLRVVEKGADDALAPGDNGAEAQLEKMFQAARRAASLG